jgi:hypothetical protein
MYYRNREINASDFILQGMPLAKLSDDKFVKESTVAVCVVKHSHVQTFPVV